jgi:hypothetical protein
MDKGATCQQPSSGGDRYSQDAMTTCDQGSFACSHAGTGDTPVAPGEAFYHGAVSPHRQPIETVPRPAHENYVSGLIVWSIRVFPGSTEAPRNEGRYDNCAGDVNQDPPNEWNGWRVLQNASCGKDCQRDNKQDPGCGGFAVEECHARPFYRTRKGRRMWAGCFASGRVLVLVAPAGHESHYHADHGERQ